ncbi:hypothetical protein M3223_16865 [Paenibacillus pasadenensis]|nr:hypothetical protein [Paenibacillus pasadenensis]
MVASTPDDLLYVMMPALSSHLSILSFQTGERYKHNYPEQNQPALKFEAGWFALHLTVKKEDNFSAEF